MKNNEVRIFVVGVGYVGLVTSACLAELGHSVCGVDINREKIKKLRRGKSPIYEPGLEELLKKNLESGRLDFQVGIDEKINEFDAAIIAVGTPEREKDGKADLFYISETARHIAQNVNKDEFIVIGKSTVPIGTADQIKESLGLYNRKTKFRIGSNPETLREGSAVSDFMNPDRIIIGGDRRAQRMLLRLYEKIDCPKIVTDAKSAEMIKLAANFMLALRVSATNMLSRICDMTGADIETVMRGVGMDKRIGPDFLKAGIGYGGSCFPKDTKSIRSIAEYHRLDTSLFDSVIEINKRQRRWFCKKVEAMTSLFTLKGRKVAVWGLAFKPNTDDIREAPSIDIINWLLEEEARVRVYDPVASVEKIFGDKVKHCPGMYEAVDGAEILLIVTEWDEFKKADMARVKEKMQTAKIVDGRNIYNPDEMRKLGFEYASMGRP